MAVAEAAWLVFTAAVLRLYFRYTTGMCKSDTRMEGKTVIVTGANTGIGYETAKDLAGRGARVILACRDEIRGTEAVCSIIKETGNSQVLCKLLDLENLNSVRKFAEDIKESEPKIDVLINNAGADGLDDRHTKDGLNLLMQVNHFGPFLLTNLLLETLVKSAPSRIIFVSSLRHKLAKFNVEDINMDRATQFQKKIYCYGNSKLCNILISNELARRLKGMGVTVNCLHPGLVKTEIFRRASKSFMFFFDVVLHLFAKSPREGAQTTITLAATDLGKNYTGQYFSDCKLATSHTSTLARDDNLGKKVWDISEKLVGLTESENML